MSLIKIDFENLTILFLTGIELLDSEEGQN